MRLARFDLPMLVLSISALYFLASGIHGAIHQSWDFVPVYSGARCMVLGCNPYSSAQLDAEYLSAGGQEDIVEQAGGWDDESQLYPPSTLVTLAPIGLLRFPAALWVWSLLNAILFAAAVIIVFSLCPPGQRWLAAGLASFFLVNGIEMVKDGQASSFAVSTLTIGVCLLLTRRRLLPAACLLLLSLAVKPQIGILVVLYFLTDRAVRRYAATALCGALALLLLGSLILEARPATRNWTAEIRSNIVTSMAPGKVNDPAFPATGEIHLEALTSALLPTRNGARALATSIFLVLILAWAFICLPHHSEPILRWLALGGLSVLSLLPVYHRHPDASLLVLSVPAVLMLIGKRRMLGAVLAVLTVLASASIPSFLDGYLAAHAPLLHETFLHNKVLVFAVLNSASELSVNFQHMLRNKLLFTLTLRQENLALLLLACLYIVAAAMIRFPRKRMRNPVASAATVSSRSI